MRTAWYFFAVLAKTPAGFTWRWQKQSRGAPVTSEAFDFYFDCVSNARDNGYTGPLPAGPKVPLGALPNRSSKTERESTARPGGGFGATLAVVPVTARAAGKRRRTFAHA